MEDEEEPIKGFMNHAMTIMLNTTKFLYAFLFTFTASAGVSIDLVLGLNYSRASGVQYEERAKAIFNNNVGKEASSRKENINTLKL